MERELEPDDVEMQKVRTNLGNLLFYVGRLDEADLVLSTALECSTQLLGPMHADSRRMWAGLASVRSARNETDSAIELMTRSLEITVATFGATHMATVSARGNLGALLSRAGRDEEAEEQFRLARAILIDNDHIDDADAVAWFANRVGGLMSRRAWPAAFDACNELIAAREKLLGDDNILVATSRGTLSVILVELGRVDEACTTAEAALAAARKAAPDTSPQVKAIAARCATVFERSGRSEDARRVRDELALP
jgi:tetratricopeptide (TPR) repeat protein